MSTYNEWANYATWNFMEWHGDQLKEYAEEFADYFNEMSLSEVSDDIEAWAWEETGMNELPIGFARDAASNVFTDISWTQIADRVLVISHAHLVRMED